MQVPGPTLIVTEGRHGHCEPDQQSSRRGRQHVDSVSGFNVTTAAAARVCTGPTDQEAAPGHGDLHVHCDHAGNALLLQRNPRRPADRNGTLRRHHRAARDVPPTCTSGLHERFGNDAAAQGTLGLNPTFGSLPPPTTIPQTCYDREYLFQFSEMDPRFTRRREEQVAAAGTCTSGLPGCSLNVPTEPYHPAYFMINGRSMPDVMDPNYAPDIPISPITAIRTCIRANWSLLRIIGQGRWQHPFHEHANHVRILARDGNLILTSNDANSLAGPALFTTTTTPGQAMDGIFYYTGRGLNWDMYGHHPGSTDPTRSLSCTPDANGYNTGASRQRDQLLRMVPGP